MTGEDAADVGAPDDGGQLVLMPQLEDVEQRQMAGQRRVVHRQERAVRRRLGEDLGEPRELRRVEVAVMPPGNARVEGHQTQPVEIPHPGDRLFRGLGIEEDLAQHRALVMVARDPDHGSAEFGGDRLDRRTQPAVRIRLAEVCEVPGDHDGGGSGMHGADRLERPRERALDVVPSPSAAPPARKCGSLTWIRTWEAGAYRPKTGGVPFAADMSSAYGRSPTQPAHRGLSGR